MGLLHEYSQPGTVEYSPKPEPKPLDHPALNEAATATPADAAPASTDNRLRVEINGRLIFWMSTLVLPTMLCAGMLLSIPLVFSNAELLMSADPNAAAQDLIFQLLEDNPLMLLLNNTLVSLVGWSVGVGFVLYRLNRDWTQIGLHRLDPNRVNYALMVGAVAGLSISGGNLMAAQLTGTFPELRGEFNEVFNSASFLLVGVLLFIGIFILPAAEELFFRGVLYTWIRRDRRPAVAMLIVGVIYAILGQNLVGFVPYILLGMGLCWMYDRTGSVLGSYFAHSAFNFVSIAVYATVLMFS